MSRAEAGERLMSFGLTEGLVFAGRYRVGRVIGMGGMGAVYEVVHIETNRRRALKIMLPTLFESDELRERFKREAKVAADIDSEFIVDVFDAGVDAETRMPFLVMELLQGEDLDHRVERLGALPPAEVVLYLHQAALALDKTHRAAIVHRDLKPENLFLTQREDGQPRIKVLDFGIAKLLADGSQGASATQGVGTPLYMAPEQFGAGAPLSSATDVYALGMLAYKLLVGVTYWADEEKTGNLFAILAAASNGTPQPASVRAAARGVVLPSAFDAWFANATALKPSTRFQVATTAVRALADALDVAPPAVASQPLPWASGMSGIEGTGVLTPAPLAPTPPEASAASIANTLRPAAASRGSATDAGLQQTRTRQLLGVALTLGLGALLGAGVYAANAGRTSTPKAEPAAAIAPVTVTTAPPAAAPAASMSAAPVASMSAAPVASTNAAPVATMSAAPAALPRKKRYTRD